MNPLRVCFVGFKILHRHGHALEQRDQDTRLGLGEATDQLFTKVLASGPHPIDRTKRIASSRMPGG